MRIGFGRLTQPPDFRQERRLQSHPFTSGYYLDSDTLADMPQRQSW